MRTSFQRPASSSNLRRRVEKLYWRYRGILILANGVKPAIRKELDRSVSVLPRLPRRRLAAEVGRLKREVLRVERYYGFKGSQADIDRVLSFPISDSGSGDSHLFLEKWYLSELFDRYDRVLPNFARFPPHARIAIDVIGVRTSGEGLEVFQLEAALFEDMAALWNGYLDARAGMSRRAASPVQVKRWHALLRSTIRAAFCLVEGYLNCLAADVLLLRAVTDSERERLQERDSRSGRPRLLSLRDKLIQYPRIAARTPEPPLLESDCTEMATILKEESELRHALIHPTTRIDPTGRFIPREPVYLQLSDERVAVLCDSAVSLILRIGGVVGSDFGDTSVWISPRGADGRFPDRVFA